MTNQIDLIFTELQRLGTCTSPLDFPGRAEYCPKQTETFRRMEWPPAY